MFQRMMAIPQEEYLQLTAAQQMRQPLLRQFYNLENQYEQQEHINDPYRKLVHQSETLDAMKALKDKMRQEIVLATPKPYQSRARGLFQHLEPVLMFNERGEIFDEQNQVISQSRIEDLIQYAVRDRRRPFLPVGWSSFLKTLQDHNIPKFVLNRDTLEELENDKKTENKVVKTEVKTPKVESALARKRKREPTDSDTPIKQRPQRSRKQTTKYGVNFLSKF